MSLQRKYNNFFGFIKTVGVKAFFAYVFLFFLKKMTKTFNFFFDRVVTVNAETQQVSLLHWDGVSAKNYSEFDEWKVLKKFCDDVIQYQIVTIGDQSYDLLDDAIWFYDPVNKSYIDKSVSLSNYVTELKYSSFDLRVIWELNRLQFLIPLAQISVITGDRVYIDYALKLLNKWIEQNGYISGPNWIDAQESGIRLVNVLLFKKIIEKMGGHISLPKGFVFYHVKFLIAGLSIRRITHNHFFTEACSLYATLLLLKPRFFSWTAYFISSVIMIEVNKQLDKDGFGYEGSSNYTLFVYDALSLVSALEVDCRLMYLSRKIDYFPFVTCCSSLDLNNGDIVKIGDADCGRYVKINWAVDLSRPLEKELFQSFVDKENSALSYLNFLFAQPSLLLSKTNKKLNQTVSFTYQNNRAGLFISTKNSKKIVIQGGATRINNDVGIDHVHSDLMSFMYFFEGKNIFIDPGTFLYINGLTQRQALRHAKRHNCVVIDDHEYAEQGKSFFGITNLALVERFEVREEQGSVEVDCELIMRGSVLKRHFTLSADLSSLQIHTSGKMSGRHSVVEYINMSNKVHNLNAQQCFLPLGEDKQIRLCFHQAFDPTKSKDKSLIKLNGKTIAWASRYGSLRRGYQIKRTMNFDSQFAFSTMISLEEGIDTNG